jgi:uncharacterized protein (TIGR02145 family)
MQYSTASGSQGLCPDGWHIPIWNELLELQDAVEGNSNTLKEIGQGTGDGVGTNTSGFSALLEGRRSQPDGLFRYLNFRSNFWSSTQDINSITAAGFLSLASNNSVMYNNVWDKGYGHSIRCLKD